MTLTLLHTTHTPGTAAAWLEAGQPPRFTCSGVSNLTSSRPVTPETVFEAASLSKPVFAACALRLAEAGQLDLDRSIAAFLPPDLLAADPRAEKITPRLVLRHASGLPNWFRRGEPRGLLFPPGQRFSYSGQGYDYLQAALDSLTGQGLNALARRLVFQPLGMTSSAYTWQAHYAAETAQGHDPEGRPLRKKHPRRPSAGSSLHASLADFAAFIQALFLEKTVLTPGMLGEMLAPQTPIDTASAWGLGIGLKRVDGDWLAWQWGDNTGFKHVLAVSPARGQALVVFTNGELGWQVWDYALRQAFDPRGEILAFLDQH